MTIRRFSVLVTLALILTLATILAGCGASSTAPVNPPSTAPLNAPSGTTAPSSSSKTDQAGHTVITVTDSAFKPATVTIKVGAPAVWDNESKATLKVVFDDGSVTSPDIAPTKVATHTFTKAGTFKYHSSQNPQMTGTVIVK